MIYRLKKFVHNIINLFFNLGQNPIYINAYVSFMYGRLFHTNFGDDLNVYLIQKISKKKVFIYDSSLIAKIFKKKNYVCIGSILDWIINSRSVVWGAGIISEKSSLKVKPLEVCAVRGKISREFLLKNNISCPEVYGDPALLLPLFYESSQTKVYDVGIILHVSELDSVVLPEIFDHVKVCFINLRDYTSVEQVIAQITSCKFIISSSLHGLIVSDAYNIPNLWGKFSEIQLVGDKYLKFYDYFSGVGRTYTEPIDIRDVQYSDLQNLISLWTPIKFDSKKLLNACPFFNGK